MATLHDISLRTGVSVTTISRVLNHDKTMAVSKETSRAIFAAAFELGYVSPRKRRQSKEKHLTIAVADWHIIAEGCPNVNISTLRYYAEIEAPLVAVDFIQLGRTDTAEVNGIIAFGDFSEHEIDHMREISPYIVFVDSNRTDFTYDRVLMEQELAMKQALDYLLYTKKHKIIGYIGGLFHQEGFSIGMRRMQNVVSMLMNQQLYIPELVKTGQFTPEAGYQMASQMISSPMKPEGLIVGSDVIASGVLQALKEYKISLPEDMSLVIYKDIETVALPEGNYAVVQVYPDLVWQKAVQMLLERINGRTEAVRIVLSPKLVLKNPDTNSKVDV